MPNIYSIPEVYYTGLMPYRHEFDNMPLRNILGRQTIINNAVDTNRNELDGAHGSASSVNARLSASLQDSGALKTSAVDAALHDIEEHTDSSTYVRMLSAERDKLTLIEDESNLIEFNFETAGASNTPVLFENGTVVMADSVSTAWRYQTGKMYLDLNFPLTAIHRHYYDIQPVHVSNYKNYKVNSVSTPYMTGSLRVYINGTRLGEDEAIYVPGELPTDAWTLNKFTPTAAAGTFKLDTAITASDVIRIDFDVQL